MVVVLPVRPAVDLPPQQQLAPLQHLHSRGLQGLWELAQLERLLLGLLLLLLPQGCTNLLLPDWQPCRKAAVLPQQHWEQQLRASSRSSSSRSNREEVLMLQRRHRVLRVHAAQVHMRSQTLS